MGTPSTCVRLTAYAAPDRKFGIPVAVEVSLLALECTSLWFLVVYEAH